MAQKILFQTPKGTAKYAWLNRPDDAFNKENPKYTVDLRIAEADAQSLIELAQQVANDNFGKGNCKMPFAKDAETGDVVFKLKSKYQPKFADSQGTLIVPEQLPNVTGGSVMRVKGSFYPYSVQGNGISMQMSAVQIIELVEAKVEFEPEEGGFVATQKAANSNEKPSGDAYDF